MTLDEVKLEVALGSRILSMTGLAAGIRSSMGHVSLRDPNDSGRFVVKGRGYPIDVLNRMRPEYMVVCDLDGRLIDGPPGVVQCNEVMIHASVF
ncbi:MAG: class II aldolase/adducin family protein, partial [Burkholderiales bacterium]